ncbi:hypothetical protein VTI74DRAFT_3122 [Chaetomium olivicolor]
MTASATGSAAATSGSSAHPSSGSHATATKTHNLDRFRNQDMCDDATLYTRM